MTWSHESEMVSMNTNQVWTLVYLFEKIKPIGCKWLFKRKTNQVWTLIDPFEGIKPIGCEWLFKRKTDMDNNL